MIRNLISIPIGIISIIILPFILQAIFVLITLGIADHKGSLVVMSGTSFLSLYLFKIVEKNSSNFRTKIITSINLFLFTIACYLSIKYFDSADFWNEIDQFAGCVAAMCIQIYYFF